MNNTGKTETQFISLIASFLVITVNLYFQVMAPHYSLNIISGWNMNSKLHFVLHFEIDTSPFYTIVFR